MKKSRGFASILGLRFSPGDGGSFLLELQKAIEEDKALVSWGSIGWMVYFMEKPHENG